MSSLHRLPYILIVVLIVVLLAHCRPASNVSSEVSLPVPDSLRVTVSSSNISENMTGSDEILVACYVRRDSAERLDEPVFLSRFYVSANNPSRTFQIKLDKRVIDRALLLFLVELDSELPVATVDSLLRTNHYPIRKAFSARDYTAMEKYFGDDDVLGFRVIPRLNLSMKNVYDFVGRYKLDKYEYRVVVENYE